MAEHEEDVLPGRRGPKSHAQKNHDHAPTKRHQNHAAHPGSLPTFDSLFSFCLFCWIRSSAPWMHARLVRVQSREHTLPLSTRPDTPAWGEVADLHTPSSPLSLTPQCGFLPLFDSRSFPFLGNARPPRRAAARAAEGDAKTARDLQQGQSIIKQ